MLFLSVGRDHFTSDRLRFFRGQHPRHRHCFELTHRFDAVFTVEVALSSGLCLRANQCGGVSTSFGIIDQHKRKAYTIAERFRRVLQSRNSERVLLIRRDMAPDKPGNIRIAEYSAREPHPVFSNAQESKKTARSASAATTESEDQEEEGYRFHHRRRPDGNCAGPGSEGGRIPN